MMLGELDDHLLTWFSASLLFAGLVRMLDEISPLPRKRHGVLAVCVGLFVALNLASDPLLYFAGIVLVTLAAVVVCRRFPSALREERSH